MERLQAAQENLAIAKENLSSSQSAAGVVPKEDATMISDTEDIPAKAHESAAGEKIAASFQDLANNLQALHTQAVQAVQQEVDQQDRKRPRVDSPSSKEKTKRRHTTQVLARASKYTCNMYCSRPPLAFLGFRFKPSKSGSHC